MTHEEMTTRMSAAEFARWIALYQREARDQEQEAMVARRKAQLAQRGITI